MTTGHATRKTPAGSTARTRRGQAALDVLVASAIGPVFLLVAAWMVFGPEPEVPTAPTAAVDRSDVGPFPRRPTLADPPTLQVAGFEKRCTDCHDLFRSSPDTPLRLNQHRDIVQAHGMNDRCFNCHDNHQRHRLVLTDGSTVPFSESPLLCASCHGPTYRDWQLGMHGRTDGHWDPKDGLSDRLACTECHDPHAPAFSRMPTWPGPNTLRMGPRRPEGAKHGGKRNPLQHWSDPFGAKAGEGGH